MATFFAPNIDRRGRIARLIFGLVLLIAALACLLGHRAWWLCALLAAFGIFAVYEAFRGWCLMRACGVKTKL